MNKLDFNTYSISCYATKSQCKHADNCIHKHVAKLRNEALEENQVEFAISPAYLSRVQKEGKRQYYASTEKLRFAKGMRHIFDNVPKGLYNEVRDAIMSLFSSKRLFFYYRNGERFLYPDQQAAIIEIFKEYELDPPVFDAYVNSMNWDNA